MDKFSTKILHILLKICPGGSTLTFWTMSKPKQKRTDDELSGGESESAVAACPDPVYGTFFFTCVCVITVM